MKQMIYAIIGVFSFWMIISFIIDSCSGKEDYDRQEERLDYELMRYESKAFEGCRDLKIHSLKIHEEGDTTYLFVYTLEGTNIYNSQFYWDCVGICNKYTYKILDIERSIPTYLR